MIKIIQRIVFFLFIGFALAYLFIIVSPKFFKNYYPFGIRVAIVLTGSMEPELQIDDFVVVKKPNEIKENDIVSYRETNGKEVIHRIIRIDEDEIITKGDANNTEDNPITKDQITGIYIGKVKYLGKIIKFINRPIIFSIIITILVASLIPFKKNK